MRASFVGALLALGCTSCHACVAVLLADDEPGSEATATATAPAPASATAPAPASATATAATAAATAPAPAQAALGLDGRYECFQVRSILGPNGMYQITWVPGALAGFTIQGASYTSSNKPGSLSVSGNVVAFNGGPYNGWRGVTGTNSTGFYVGFRGSSPTEPMPPGSGAKSGDYMCYRQGK